LYFLLSLFVVLVFIASVSSADGVDFLVGVLTAVLRTILVTPWLGVSFFLLVIASVEVCKQKMGAGLDEHVDILMGIYIYIYVQ
jgi:hypothetical protein